MNQKDYNQRWTDGIVDESYVDDYEDWRSAQKEYNPNDEVVKDKGIIVALSPKTKSPKKVLYYSKKPKKKYVTADLTMVSPSAKGQRIAQTLKKISKTIITSWI
jgi:hypothetical protein